MNLRYVLGQQISVGIRGLQELVTRLMFLPEQIALWNLTQVIVTVGSLLQFNVVAAVNVRVAQRLGNAEDEREITKTRSIALLLEVFQQLIVVSVIFLIGPHIWDTPKNFTQIIFISAVIVIVQTALINLLVGFHESSSKFQRLGILLPLNSIAQIILIFLGSYYGGLFGLFIGVILGFFVCICILIISLNQLNLFNYGQPDRSEAKMIAKPAVFFKVSDVGTTLFYALDVIIASLILSPSNLAFFMTAKVLAGLLSQSLFALNRMNLIKLGNDFGAKKDRRVISTYLSIQFFTTFLIFMPLIVILSVPLLDFIFPIILPDYELSLLVLPYFLLCTLCSPRALFLRNVWIQAMAWKNIFLSGIFATSIFLIVFSIGDQTLDTQNPENLALIVFLGQLPYVVFIIIGVSLYIAGVKQTILWLIMFVLSTFQIVLILDILGSIRLFDLAQNLTVVTKIGYSIILYLVSGFLCLYVLRKVEELSGSESYVATLMRAFPR